MVRTAVTSKIITSLGYDPATRTLQVEFLRHQNQTVRPVYDYHDVSPAAYAALMGKDVPEGEKHSIGSYFLRMIKPNHKFTKVEEKDENQTQTDTPPAAA